MIIFTTTLLVLILISFAIEYHPVFWMVAFFVSIVGYALLGNVIPIDSAEQMQPIEYNYYASSGTCYIITPSCNYVTNDFATINFLINNKVDSALEVITLNSYGSLISHEIQIVKNGKILYSKCR